MYLGRIVESADHATLWRNPRHPYTRALLASIPSAKLDKRPAAVLTGEAGQAFPSADAGSGRVVRWRSSSAKPMSRPCGSPDGNAVACHLAQSAGTPSYENESGAKRYHDQHRNDRL
jgi:peptide/nickel transport system ATP-binding protein